MKRCPKCSGVVQVVNSREIKGRVRRRRVCQGCDFKFSTVEIPVAEATTLQQVELVKARLDGALIMIQAVSDELRKVQL